MFVCFFHCCLLTFHCFSNAFAFHYFCLFFLAWLLSCFSRLFHCSCFFSNLSKRHGGEALRPPPNPPLAFFILRTFHDLSIDLSICLPIYLFTYLPIHLSTHLPTYLSFCHSSALAFLLLPSPSSIQNAFSTFFIVFFEIHAFILLSTEISTFS